MATALGEFSLHSKSTQVVSSNLNLCFKCACVCLSSCNHAETTVATRRLYAYQLCPNTGHTGLKLTVQLAREPWLFTAIIGSTVKLPPLDISCYAVLVVGSSGRW